MIEINLLPGARKKRGGKAGFQMPDFKALATSIKDPWLAACIVSWVLVLAVVGFLYAPRRSAIAGLQPKLTAARNKANELKVVLRAKGEAEATRDTIIRQINIIRDIDRERYTWPHILDAVTKALPPYTWLDKITSTTTEGDSLGAGQVSLEITGKSADIQAITRFMRNLEESPFLENATPVSNIAVNERGRDVYAYVLNVRYQRPDSAQLTLQPLAASLVQGYRSGAARTGR